MKDLARDAMVCIQAKCKKEMAAALVQRDKMIKEVIDLTKKNTSGAIKPLAYAAKMAKLVKEKARSPTTALLVKCQLAECNNPVTMMMHKTVADLKKSICIKSPPTKGCKIAKQMEALLPTDSKKITLKTHKKMGKLLLQAVVS